MPDKCKQTPLTGTQAGHLRVCWLAWLPVNGESTVFLNSFADSVSVTEKVFSKNRWYDAVGKEVACKSEAWVP